MSVEQIKAKRLVIGFEPYKTIKTHCSLRNALPLRFWVKNGFDRITEVECTGNLYPGHFWGLGLMKAI